MAPISQTLDTTGILARSVEDCALLDQIVTRDTTASTSQRSDLRGVRFAHAPRQYMKVIDPETAAHFTAALERLRDGGADVVEIDLGDDFMNTTNQLTWNFFFHEMREAVTQFVARNTARSSSRAGRATSPTKATSRPWPPNARKSSADSAKYSPTTRPTHCSSRPHPVPHP